MKKSISLLIISIVCILLLCSSAFASSRLVTTTLVGSDDDSDTETKTEEESEEDSEEESDDIIDTLRDALENEEESNVTIEHPKHEAEKIDYTADRNNKDDDDDDVFEEYRRDKESDAKVTTAASLSGNTPRIKISQEERAEIKEAIKSKKTPKNETVKKIIQRKKRDRSNYDSIIDMVRSVLTDEKKEKAVDALLGMDTNFVKRFHQKQIEEKGVREEVQDENVSSVEIQDDIQPLTAEETTATVESVDSQEVRKETKKATKKDRREKGYEEQIEDYLEALEKPETIKVDIPEVKIKEIIIEDSDFDQILDQLWE